MANFSWRSLFYLAIGLVSYSTLSHAQSSSAPTIWEQVVYTKNVLNDKGFGYYQMTISQRYFDGTQALAIKVLPEQYNSDPDLYISINNTTPTSSLDSQWYCNKIGTDTCIIPKDSLSQGLTLYIGVQCVNPCQYTLATDYVTQYTIPNANKTQIRIDGYSSTVFQYLIPSVNSNGITRAVDIQVQSENEYDPIDLYFSLDNVIYQLEERKVENILSSGAGYHFTEQDYGWCTGCYIYVLADTINEGRYYITFSATPRSFTITSSGSDLMINSRQQECAIYFVLAAANDVMLYTKQYQGDSDFYISGSTTPTDNTDPKILQFAARTPNRCLILTAEDRARWGFVTGVINVCAYAFSHSSMNIVPYEDNAGGRFFAQGGVTYTFDIESNSSTYFVFSQSNFYQNGVITVTATTYGLNTNQAPARLFYKMCQYTDSLACSLNATEQRGTGMTEIAVGWANVTNLMTRNTSFNHNASLCPNPNSCYYIINVFFADSNGPKKIDFLVGYNTTQYQQVNLDQAFQNVLQQGQYFYYALFPGSSESFAFLQSLTIKLISDIGDADLVVSVVDPSPEIDQGQYEARGTIMYDSISLNNTGNFSLNIPIYIGVYAQSFCVYRLSFEPEFNLDYNAKLVSAIPIVDSVAYPNMYLTEFQETFYSFTPWWAGYENRSMIFFADVSFNNIFFHIRANDYPMYYLDNYIDVNDIIVIDPGDVDYSLYNGYYIRIRPDFQLQDLISDRQYIFNFYAFAQAQNTQIVDIQLNELKLGYGNLSRSVYYRHFIVENNATYNFSVIPIIGNPAILLKLSNVPVYPVSSDVTSWDYKTDNPGLATDSIIVTFVDRSSRNASCASAGFNLNAGNRSCGFFLAIECQADCIFNITVQIIGRENQSLPKYLLEDDYYTGSVTYNQYSYFYYPLSANNTGEMVIILNKTGNLYQNGDSMILATLMSSSANLPISNWSYPTTKNYSIASSNYKANQAEILELCSSVIKAKCTSSSCILMIGVLGLTPNVVSNFRLIAQKQVNKLYDKNPIIDYIPNANQYKYYWFTSNASVSNPYQAWQYQITASPSVQGTDVDLFVSILDGRYPVAEDYDFASQNIGPESIFISSQSSFFDNAGYNKSNGILFIVGVRSLTPNVTFTLMMTGPNQTNISMTNLIAGQLVQTGLLGTATNKTNYYKWYNWGQKDFRLNVEVSSGNVSVFLNYVGEEVYLTNGFQALPMNQNNSLWLVYLNASQAGVLQVSKNNIGVGQLFCYYCWYYITVTTNYTAGPSSYRLSINEVPDVGEEITQISLNTSSSLTLPATGTVSQLKFMLDGKDPFQIQATVTVGYLIMYVGLYPDAPRTNYQFYAEGSSNLVINVKQADLNFQVGAWYYITLQSGQGRTSFNVQVNQRRTIQQLESGIVYKQQYWNTQERIKFYFFKAPTFKTPKFISTITVQSLSPGFYPVVLLNKLTLTAVPSDYTKLSYPNIKYSNYTFGDNFFQIVNQNNFTYQFTDTGGTYVYYTMALYSFSYGMTDMRKPTFKITMKISNSTLSSSNSFDQSNFANRFILPKQYSSNEQSFDDISDDSIDIDWIEEDDGVDQEESSTISYAQQKQVIHFSKHEGHQDAMEKVEELANSLDNVLQRASNYITSHIHL